MPTVGTSDEFVTGLSDLVDNLNSLPLALGTQKNILARAGRQGGEPIRARAAELAPVYDGAARPQKRRGKTYMLVPGTLRESMSIVVADQSAVGVTVKIGPSRPGFYGGPLEWGGAHQAAEPFLRPAFDEKLDEAVAIIGFVLGSEIEKALLKL